ncbi:hypothetical protein PMAYCL1PPCAC_14663, partial [Pristionchus mayeri]
SRLPFKPSTLNRLTSSSMQQLLLLLLYFASAALASSNCGIRLSNRGRGILGHLGRVSSRNEVSTTGKWPWQIMLREKQYRDNGTSFINMCGGTIIGAQWILTAAHCVRYSQNGIDVTVKDAFVFAEVTSMEMDNVVDSMIDNHVYRMRDAFPHDNYTNKEYPHDIALIKLENPIEFDRSVSPICLPNSAQDIPSDGQAVVIGFGQSSIRGTNEAIRDGNLRETIVPIVGEHICEARWTNLLDITGEKWRENRVICAGAYGHDTGSGDSGGPLMMKSSDGRWFQIGVTSFGNPSTEADLFPGLYTDVREYCDWINDTTKGEVKCQEKEVKLRDVEIKI